VSGGIDMLSDCLKSALRKNKNGIINNKREAAVNFFESVAKVFMFTVFIEGCRGRLTNLVNKKS
jgi:hypothetical protein